jgi:hypothetical protein
MELTLSKFFFDIPIYEPIEIDDKNRQVFKKIIDCNINEEFEGYNPWEKVESTFKVVTDLVGRSTYFIDHGGYGNVLIKCKRTDQEFHFYIIWDPSTKTLMKVGQFPSVADFHLSEIKQYTKLLTQNKLKEFSRAIGLAANGVGIGSFVYLRRIFEFLIDKAYEEANRSTTTIDKSVFQTSRMDEKIEMLKSHLPNFLVENKGLYSILSLGIHELDEVTCLTYFNTVRTAIEIILDEKLEEKRKKKKIEKAKHELIQLKSKIKK